MRVEGSSNGNSMEVIARIQQQHKTRGLSGEKSVQSGAKATPADSGETPAAPETSPEKGVLRLIQEGHFKGVADVRLRINFAEELQALEVGNVSAALKEGLTALQTELSAAIDSFVAGGTLSEEEVTTLRGVQEAFNTRVGELLESEALTEDVFGELRTAFEDFLNGLLPPEEIEEETPIIPADGAPEEAVTEEVVETEVTTPLNGTEAPGTDAFAGLRETLTGIFDGALSSLQSSIDDIKLPPLSEPQGNGRAYEKFLATYNELYGIGGVEDPPVADITLNTSV